MFETTNIPSEENAGQMRTNPPELRSMHVVSNIRNRYARTVVTSKYFNPNNQAQETTFSIILPDSAFITGFIMEFMGTQYEAYVKEKEEAKSEYDQAVSQGISAAHVGVCARDSNNFTVSVNIEPQSDITFILTYEELLVRKHSKYEMVINLHPGQFIDDLGVDIYINETRPIINVETPALKTGNEITNETTKNELAVVKQNEEGVYHVSFYPTIQQQKQIAEILKEQSDKTEVSLQSEINGIAGQFIIMYEVERDPKGGEVLVSDGYFVHFFAPTELKPIPKHVIFVLDVSGSMGGRKLKQLKEAMFVILDQLNPNDYFNIVKFSDDICVLKNNYLWEVIENSSESKLPQSFKTNEKNINAVKKVIKELQDESSTNISDALIVGLRLTSKGIEHLNETDITHKPQPIIVFLTDGKPNQGETDPKKNVDIVNSRNDCDNKSVIFTLAFGGDADNDFLKELAIKNSGFMRKIYEAADSSLQLQDFYKQISCPLLTNVTFKYPEQVQDTSKHEFDVLFDGSEFVVVGKIDEMLNDFVFVEAKTLEGTNQFRPNIKTQEYGNLERLWAYMTIKQLLNKKYEKIYLDNNFQKETAEKEALHLALKYSFVTPLTSLVVIKPNELTENKKYENMENQAELLMEDFSGIRFKSKCTKKMLKKRKLNKAEPISIVSVEDMEQSIVQKTVNINCKIDSNIAHTTEKITFFNCNTEYQSKTFEIDLPQKSILKECFMECNTQIIKAIGRDEEGRNEYQNLVTDKKNVLFIDTQNPFKLYISVHIMPLDAITLILEYETSLERNDNKYELILNLHGEKVTEKINVYIHVQTLEGNIKYVDNLILRNENRSIKIDDRKLDKHGPFEFIINFESSENDPEKETKDFIYENNNCVCQFILNYELEINSNSEKVLECTNSLKTIPFPFLIAYHGIV